MIIQEIKAYDGRNIYSHQKVVKMVVDLKEWDDIPTNKIPNFNNRLLKLLPGLSLHHCSLGYEGGFKKRLMEGTYLAHVIEHTALELLNCIGHKVSFGEQEELGDKPLYYYLRSTRRAYWHRGWKISVKLIQALCLQREFDMERNIKDCKKWLGGTA